MSDKQTMQLEYKFMAEDANLSSTIERMENSLEGFNGETKEAITNLNKAEKEMREFASSASQAQRNIKSAESAFEYLNSTSKQNSKTMENFAEDIVKATSLTKKLAQEQKRLYTQTNKVQSKGTTPSQLNTLTDDINVYRGQIVELNNLDKRLSSTYKTLQTNRAIAAKGYNLSQEGSYEKEYFSNKISAIDKSLAEYKNKMNSVAQEKQNLMRNFNKSNNAFDKLLSQNNIEIIGSENALNKYQKSVKNDSNMHQKRIKNNQKYVNKTNSNKKEENGTFSSNEELKRTINNSNIPKNNKPNIRRGINLTKEEVELLEKSERILTDSKKEVEDNKYKNRIAYTKEQAEAEKELIKVRTEAANLNDTIKTNNDVRKHNYKTEDNIKRDNNRSKNKKEEIEISKKLNVEGQKEILNHKHQLKAMDKTNTSRKNLIANLDKQTNKYENLSKSASNYKEDLKNIDSQVDKVVKQNVLQADSFDKVDKSMRSKSKSLLTLVNRAEDYQAKTKDLLQQSTDYQKVLSDKKIKIEADIDDLNKIGTESVEAKEKLEKLQAELNETEAEMEQLESSTNKLISELNRAGGELVEFGSDFDKLENKIDTCKSSIDSFENKVATVASAGSKVSSTLSNASQRVSSFGKGVRSVGADITNLGREMQFLSLVGAGIFGSSFTLGMDYEGELANVRATLNTIGKEAGYADKAMDKISERVREISSNSIYSPSETMEMAKYLSLAGYDLEKILSTIEPMSQLMSLTGIEDASHGVDLLTDSFASLGLGIKQANESDIDFAKRFEEEVELYMDTLARMQSVSNQDISQAMEAYIYAGGEFDRLNIPLEQSGALLSVLASRGLKSAEAGRGLSSTLINLTKESGQSYEALKELNSLTGIDVFARFDENGSYKLEQQLTNISTAFEKIYDKYGESKGAEIVNRLTGGIAGKTQIKTFSKLLEGYKNEYTEIKGLLSEGTVEGSMDNMMEEKTKSIEYKFKMMTASIQESLVSLFDVVKPYIEKAIDVITQLSDAFRKLSDDDKLQLTKLLGLTTILPFIVMAFGALVQVIGIVITAIGTLSSGIFKFSKVIFDAVKNTALFVNSIKNLGFVETLASKFPLIAGQIKNLSLGLKEAGGVASATGGKFSGLLTKLGKAGGVIGSVIAFIHNVKVAILGLKDSFTQAGGAFEWFISFLKHPLDTLSTLFMNIGKQFEHSVLSGFKSVAPKLSVAIVNIGRFITKACTSLIPGLNKLLGDDFDKLFDGLEEKAKRFAQDVQGVSSMLDEEAKAKGYTSYNDEKNASKKLSFDFEFNGLDDFTNGAIGRLLNLHENGETITIETIGRSKESLSEVVSQHKSINRLRKQNSDSIKKESELTDEILKKREEMSKYEVGSDKYKELKAEYDALLEEKELLVEVRIQNQEEIEQQLAELEEKKRVIEVEYKEAEKKGLGDEYIYYNLNEEFEKEFGISLVFDNKGEIETNLNNLLASIPDAKKKIEALIEVSEGETRNQLVGLLAKFEGMELAIPVALEIVEQQEIQKKYGGENGEVAQKRKIVEDIEVKMSGLEEGSTAWNELNKQLEPAKQSLKEAEDYLEGANTKLKELEESDPQVFKNAIELSKHLTENKSEPWFKLFDDNELAVYKQLTGKDLPNANKTAETKNNSIIPEGAKKKDDVSDKKVNQNVEVKTEYNKDGSVKSTSMQIGSIKKETDAINDNTEAINNNNEAKKNNSIIPEGAKKKTNGTISTTTPTLIDNGETPITDSVQKDIESANNLTSSTSILPPEVQLEGNTPITDNVETDVENAKSTLEQLQGKAQETLSAFGEIDMSNLVEVFSVVLAIADEVRQRIIDIGNVANNSLKNNLTTSADGLLEKLSTIRESIINLGNVANNSLREAFSGALDGLAEKISTIRESIINLGNVANNYLTNCLNNAGNGLKTSLQSAREVLLSICNVALNRGVASMQSVGQSLSNSMNGARDKLLSICNVALNRGVSAMSSMGQALSSSLSGALAIVNRVASVIDGAVRKANSIKIPSIPSSSPTIGTASLSAPQSLASMMRSTSMSNNSSSTISTSSSSFNFAIDKVITNSNADLRKSASRLTTYCKRRGLF